jgi:iron(II)-dependent oxidoreductase
MKVTVLLMSLAAFAAAQSDDMVSIPGGAFTMGRTKLTADDNTKMRPHVLLDDRPARKVTIRAFRLDKYEVTNEKYSAFVKARGQPAPYHWRSGAFPEGGARFPVFNVSWNDANAFCGWAGKRLPSEAEWERAARGGKDALDYPDSDKLDSKQARFDSLSGPAPVGSYPPNAFGLFDMAGNVSEWTADWFDGQYYSRGQDEDPAGPSTGEYKVIRGGAWSDPAKRVTVFFRNWVRPVQRTPNIGFRCAQ